MRRWFCRIFVLVARFILFEVWTVPGIWPDIMTLLGAFWAFDHIIGYKSALLDFSWFFRAIMLFYQCRLIHLCVNKTGVASSRGALGQVGRRKFSVHQCQWYREICPNPTPVKTRSLTIAAEKSPKFSTIFEPWRPHPKCWEQGTDELILYNSICWNIVFIY